MNKKVSILIVDDDASMCETLSDILEDKGYSVVIAKDGLRAVAEAGRRHFDLTLIDIMMPGMNGVETLQGIKMVAPETKTMIMTGHNAMEEPIYEALTAGVDRVLFKPFNVEGLVELISRETGATTDYVDMPAVDFKKYQV